MTTGSRSIPCAPVWRCQPACCPCQASDNYAEGHPASAANPRPLGHAALSETVGDDGRHLADVVRGFSACWPRTIVIWLLLILCTVLYVCSLCWRCWLEIKINDSLLLTRRPLSAISPVRVLSWCRWYTVFYFCAENSYIFIRHLVRYMLNDCCLCASVYKNCILVVFAM